MIRPLSSITLTTTLIGLVIAGCSSPQPLLPFPDIETREDLVHVLEGLNYDVTPLSPLLFFGNPAPVAAYRVVQSDGHALALLAYSPADTDRKKFFINRTAEFVRDGSVWSPQQIFQKGSVSIYLYGYSYDRPISMVQTEIYTDLEKILGPPNSY